MHGAQSALVTGASSGIGYELARYFARAHYQLVLVARDEQRLRAIADEFTSQFGVRVHSVPMDLSQPSAPTDLFDALAAQHLQVDVLVNNAGFGTFGPFAQVTATSQLEMIQVNVAALTHLTRLALDLMLQRRHGKVLNVASTAAFQPGPLMAVYYATKAYVLSFTEALAVELEGTGVTVTALCPGPTTSSFQERAGIQGARLVRGGLMDAAIVARAGFEGLMRNQSVVIPGRRNQLLALGTRLVPRRVAARAVRYLHGKSARPPRT
jgi:short-subunit dehydrogenase